MKIEVQSHSLTAEQRSAVATILIAILDSIEAAGPMGAPAGVMFAALSAHGCTLPQFQGLMGVLEARGTVTRRGLCYILAKPQIVSAPLHGRN